MASFLSPPEVSHIPSTDHLEDHKRSCDNTDDHHGPIIFLLFFSCCTQVEKTVLYMEAPIT